MAKNPDKSKHLMNEPAKIVQDSLHGLCYANPYLKLLPEERVIYAANVDNVARKQVTLIAGGGSGHEGAYAGFVGDGLLSGAVCGGVFASPSASQVLAAIERVQSTHGVLVVVMNYTGDCLHFGLAVERAKAKGIQAKLLVVNDDIASRDTRVGGRGMAATAMVIKCCGALAAQGVALDEIAQAGQAVIEHSATLGVALDHCHVPGSASNVTLPAGEMELGMGIHNEAGLSRLALMNAHDLVAHMLDLLMPHLRLAHNGDKTRVVLMINNYGGTPALEFHVVVKEAIEQVHKQWTHLTLERVLSGSFVTSLNMPGFSLSLLTLPDNHELADRWLACLDAPVHALSWPNTISYGSKDIYGTCLSSSEDAQHTDTTTDSAQVSHAPAVLEKVLRAVVKQLVAMEPTVTSYDTVLGDGDLGQACVFAADAIDKAMPKIMHAKSMVDAILVLAETIDHHVGGTSSAIFCIYLNALAKGLLASSDDASRDNATRWSHAAKYALQALMQYTQARKGDRTMMDTLIPFVDTWTASKSLDTALEAARNGMTATIMQKPALGRTAYLSEETVRQANMPDPGAYALAQLLETIVTAAQ